MEKKHFTITLKQGWKFFVTATNEEIAISEALEHVKSLFSVDGYSTDSFEAKTDIENNAFTIEEFNGFVLNAKA